VVEDILSEQQMNQEANEKDDVEDEHDEAVIQKLTCNKASEYLNAPQGFVGTS
jgi:hypothetical protein